MHALHIGESEKTGRRARLWDKLSVEKDSDVLGNADPAFVFPADFVIPVEDNYIDPPPSVSVELESLDLFAPTDSVDSSPSQTEESGSEFPFEVIKTPVIHTYPSAITFAARNEGDEASTEHTFALSKEVYFVTAHPCAPSPYVKYVKSPSSPTIQHIDVSGTGMSNGRISTTASVTGTCKFAPGSFFLFFSFLSNIEFAQGTRYTNSSHIPSFTSRIFSSDERKP